MFTCILMVNFFVAQAAGNQEIFLFHDSLKFATVFYCVVLLEMVLNFKFNIHKNLQHSKTSGNVMSDRKHVV